MGDRGNIRVDFGTGPAVYFYTHWRGSYALQLVAQALDSPAGRNRWDDAAYLARIIFDKLTEGAGDKETGFGIAPYEIDPENPTVTVDMWGRRARIGQGPWFSFEGFIKQYK